MQANLETLRTRIGQVADLCDAQGLRDGQHTLAARLTEVEECISMHNVREFVRRIMRIETQMRNTGGVIGETIRNCLVRLDGQTADLEDLRARMRTQECYHDLSEQGSDDEVQQRLARAEGQEATVENQSGAENRPATRRRTRANAPQRRVPRISVRTPQNLQPLDEMGRTAMSDDPTQQSLQRLTASQHQCVDQVTHLDIRLGQFRHEIRQTVVDVALTLQGVMQDAQGQGQGIEQIRHNLFNIAMEKLDSLDAHFQKYDEFMQQVLTKTDKRGRELCTAVERVINEQGDSRNIVEELATHCCYQRRDPSHR